MPVKQFVTGVTAMAAIGTAAAGLTFLAATTSPVNPAVQPVVFGTPMPQDQTANLPSADQLSSLLNSLANPNVSFASKSSLVEGGISPVEAHAADHALQKAAKRGQLPLSFSISNIQPAGPGSATADVAVSGPKLAAPVTENIMFVNQGNWVLSRSSAMTLLQAASAA
ncbi:hypothetical protein [Mycobacterium xenopi]|uniref:Low molecular weight antigen MTB12 n=1 Tax=Mycobacterium xenopi TaxID=1789 RepID=A0AAD1H0D6_MYCXE|nr:hypothetical protein [Mycobacterium xenopi]MDA3638392.1 hypothetical protein [Mycobacterium xenopi]MDA3656461.1 hypothetical protein [Mycobacterium xenopi]MDA3662289.1 hypothetical protein [Mycobacterium xenopi]ORX21651.1 hypothetical protein AWC32_21850 [Mycobacterium xenopi]SPX91634.1 Low molecular weight antigen MTB12 [Mycobacterium xenopi]